MAQLPSRYGASFPGEFFRSRELNELHSSEFDSLDKLWEVLSEEQEVDVSDTTTSTALRSHTATGQRFYRGQSNQGHGLSTSLHRFARDESMGQLSEELLGGLEGAILTEAASHGLDKNVSPGELLMILQHHAAPTRLLDVSLKPLEALYFAVEKYDARDGRLFIVWLQ